MPYSSLHALPGNPPTLVLPKTGSLEASPKTPAPLGLSPANSGIWNSLPGGARVWRLRIEDEFAGSLGLEFKHFSLPPGAVLFVYDDAKDEVHGSFGTQHNAALEPFTIHPIEGAALTLEYFEPAGIQQAGILVLDAVHRSPQLRLKSQQQGPRVKGEPAACEVDVACEQGLAWQTLTRSIVMIEGVQNCTGVLLNNTSGDGTPYVLTAHHCGSLRWSNFWFHWKRQECGKARQLGEPKLGSVFGSELIVDSPKHDFQLVRLLQTPGPELLVHYAGWDHSGALPERLVTLHHPWGDVMKISIENQVPLLQKLYWKIRRWDVGITESGSSGAPLFDPEQRVIGQLKGGPASCKNPRGDMFGRLNLEWEFLQPFLDPMGTGAATLNGMQLPLEMHTLGITGFARDKLHPTEEDVSLRGIGFKRQPEVFIDDVRVHGAKCEWITNSRMQLAWTDLALGEHVLKIKAGESHVSLRFQVVPAPAVDPEKAHGDE